MVMNEGALKKYLLEKDIHLIGDYFKKDSFKINVSSQIDLIIKLQDVLMGYHSIEKNSILSEIGKRVDRLVVSNKKLENIISRDNLYGRLILARAKIELDKLDNIYLENIYKRAMKKDEICIDKVDETNLRVMEKVEVGKIKKISFNIVEDDFINYLLKIKKKSSKDDLKGYAEEYVDKNNLNKDSLNYINCMVNIPHEGIKYLYKNRFDLNECKDDIKKIVEKELEF